MTICKHCIFHLVRVVNEHLPFPSTTSDNSVFLFNEAAFVIEPDLHALLHDLVDRDHILHYSWNMQDVPDVRLVALFVERDIIDMVCGVILIST